jgi:hypothetical protein
MSIFNLGGLLPAKANSNSIAFNNVNFSYPSRPDVSILKVKNYIYIQQKQKYLYVDEQLYSMY